MRRNRLLSTPRLGVPGFSRQPYSHWLTYSVRARDPPRAQHGRSNLSRNYYTKRSYTILYGSFKLGPTVRFIFLGSTNSVTIDKAT